MPEAPTISRSRPALKSADYAYLREQGIAQIQQLAAKTWTDHNLHDPGITMLEAICYAITEIGYRIQQPVADVLHSHPKGEIEWEKLFFPAEKILPNCPLTVKDYRKLLIDIEGVKNAHFYKADDFELEFFAQYKTVFPFPAAPEFITYSPIPLSMDHSPQRIKADGLYQVQLEFERANVEGEYRDLNNRYILSEIVLDEKKYTVGFSFPYWDETENFQQWGDSNWEISNLALTWTSQIINGQDIPANYYDYFAKIRITFYNEYADPSTVVVEDFTVRIKVVRGPEGFDESVFYDDHLAIPEGADAIPLETAWQIFFTIYKRKLEYIAGIVNKVKARLCANRNLGEDFQQLKGIRTQEIELCGNIELLPGADAYEVFTEIFYQVAQSFSLSIPFYTLGEMLNEGFALEEIFEGPRLEHGFIKTKDLGKTTERNSVYTSDLINIMMDVPGVRAVHDLTINSYIDNQLIVNGEANCIQAPVGLVLRPTFDAERSVQCLSAHYDGFEEELDRQRILRKYKERMRPPIYTPMGETVLFPSGRQNELEKYYSIQHDFPLTYGIGKEGLPSTATEARQAQAKQLKAYLLFFEQLMANFLSQLVHLQDYFSMEKQVRQTYLYQPLYQIPKVQELLRSFTNSGDTWEEYKADEQNGYQVLLKKASEDEAAFLDRRNRFLDHILARFAEDFTDYSILLFEHMAESPLERRLINLEDVISQSDNSEHICLPISCSIPAGSGITSLKFSIEYDTQVLRFDPSGTTPGLLASMELFSDIGFIGLDWSGFPIFPEEGDVLIELCFIPVVKTNTIIRFSDHPIPRAVTDENGDNARFSGKYSRITLDRKHWGAERLIDDKTDFLQGLPEISSCRARAYDYCKGIKVPPTYYSNKNISGYGLRIKRRLGFKVDKRRELSWNYLEPDHFFVSEAMVAGHPKLTFTIKQQDGTAILEGVPGILDIYTPSEIIAFAQEELNYEIYEDSPWGFNLQDSKGLVIAKNAQNYTSASQASIEASLISLDIFNHQNSEGFHLVENILLRPRYNDGVNMDRLLPVMDYQDQRVLPYSFVVMVILPSGYKRNFAINSAPCTNGDSVCESLAGARRFRDKKFRRFIETEIRTELPAHIFAHICWLDVDTNPVPADTSLNRFEEVYKAWLNLFGQYDAEIISPAQQALVDVLSLCLPQPNS